MCIRDSGEVVRVVEIPGLTTDLCGGCHLKNTAEAGLFKILSESGISAGVRRIEAVTGHGLLHLLDSREQTIAQAAAILKAKPGELVGRARSVMNEQRAAHQTIEELRSQVAGAALEDIVSAGKTVEGVLVLSAWLKGQGIEEMRSLGDRLKSEYDPVFLLLAGDRDGKLTFFATATKAVSYTHLDVYKRQVFLSRQAKGEENHVTAREKRRHHAV